MKKPRKRLRQVSKKMSARRKEYALLRVAHLAKAAITVNLVRYVQCEAPECRSRMVSMSDAEIHHKRGRLGDLLLDTRHWAILCSKCHYKVGQSPAWARKVGLLCDIGKWNTPDRTP